MNLFRNIVFYWLGMNLHVYWLNITDTLRLFCDDDDDDDDDDADACCINIVNFSSKNAKKKINIFLLHC